VGSCSGAEQYAGPDTETVDLKGNTVLPGLTDAHLHASATAELLFSFNMYEVTRDPKDSREDVLEKYLDLVGRAVDESPGDGWNPAVFIDFPGGQTTCEELDRACDEQPVALRSFDHHYLWVNSKALELSGITKNTPTPRNCVIERDSRGNPTGVFQETTAIDLFLDNAKGSDYSVAEYKDGIRAYQRDWANPFGTVLIFDALATKNAMQAYQELAEAGELTLRVKGFIYADPSKPMSQFDDIIRNRGKVRFPGSYEIDTVKFFIDGSGFSFFMKEPFEAATLEAAGLPSDYIGYPQWNLEELRVAFLKLTKAGFQIHLHCMGDGAVTLALDAFEYVAENTNLSTMRPVITHVMNISEDDIPRMARLGIIAAMQPMWGVVDGFLENVDVGFLGRTRAENHYPLGALKKAGARISAGTDFPVTIPPNPFIGIQTGITRTVPRFHPEYSLYGNRPLGPPDDPLRYAVSLGDMIESYTISGAYQRFLDELTGSIAVGKSADLVILNSDLESIDTMEIENTRVLRTYFKGKPVYTAD